jgi:hypothetical protein
MEFQATWMMIENRKCWDGMTEMKHIATQITNPSNKLHNDFLKWVAWWLGNMPKQLMLLQLPYNLSFCLAIPL